MQPEAFTPDIDSGIPVPKHDALPDMTEEEEVIVRANTAKLIADLTGTELTPTEADRETARDIFRNTARAKLPLSAYPNETIAYLAGMVSMYDGMVVRELADLKIYVVNKLIEETSSKDAKVRLTALKALGEVDGVDAFKKRTEITVQQKSTEEIEAELMARLERLTVDMGAVEEVEEEDVEDIESDDADA